MEHQTVATAQKRKTPDQETTTALCTNGCGFFGTAENDGMCSKCYRKHLASSGDGTAAARQVAVPRPPPLKKAKWSVPGAVGSSHDASSSSSSAGGGDAVHTSSSTANATSHHQDPATATANRCATCQKKVGLTGFRCRCGGTFCGSHRHADKHGCGFDYKAAGREQIAKQNPVVVPPKINRI